VRAVLTLLIPTLLGCPPTVPDTGDAVLTPWHALASGVDERPDPGACTAASLPTERLSETGCFEGTPLQPIPGVLPYEVNAPLWSDGADKGRYAAIPLDATVGLGPSGRLELPVGAVLIKQFEDTGGAIETRFVVRHDDGAYAYYTYVWDDAQSDAVRMTEGADLDGWPVPSERDCQECHVDVAGHALGTELDQLHRTATYAGGDADQLATWVHIGWLDGEALPEPDAIEPLATYDGAASTTDRARAYLHANCAYCHRPGATGAGDIDLRARVEERLMGLCGQAPTTQAVDGAPLLVSPGDPSASVLSVRMETIDPLLRMPPLGTVVPDDQGIALIDAWITETHACE
jgi:uncharacterized repeat protein (TIGR03806 family)